MCFSQHWIDSLKIILQNEPLKSKSYVDVLNQIGYLYWIVDSNESLNYGKEALASITPYGGVSFFKTYFNAVKKQPNQKNMFSKTLTKYVMFKI